MSHFAASHSILPFDAKTSRSLDGQRLAKVWYKTPRDGTAKKASVCVSIPVLKEIPDSALPALMPHLLGLVHGVQDAIIRERYEAGAQFITDSDISVAACIEFLNAEATGNRLTKESIEAWFTEKLADSLTVAFADRLGMSDTPSEAEVKKLELHVRSYKEKFAGLAGGRTSYAPEIAGKLLAVLDLVEDTGDMLTDRFRTRLQKMKEMDSVELLGL